MRAGLEVVKLFSCSTQLSMNCWHFNIYERENSIIGLSEPKIKPNFLIIIYL